MKLYDKLKKSISEVQEPLSQGEKNFKALHNPDYKNLVPGVTDQEHVFKGTPQRKDPKTASYEDSESAQAYDKNLTAEEAEIEEARRSDLYIGTVHKDDPDYEKKVGEMKKKAVGGHRVRGRAPLAKFKHLYKKGGELYTMTSQDVKPEHSARVDVYSRKAMKKEEVEQVEEENQYIEVTSKSGAVRHVEVHPSKAFAALNQYKKNGNKARIVSKKPMKEDFEQVNEGYSKHPSEDAVARGLKTGGGDANYKSSATGSTHKVTNYAPKEYRSGMMRSDNLSDLLHTIDKKVNNKAPAVGNMKFESAEQVNEVITKKTPLKDVIHDFVHSKNPKFAGKSKKQRMKQALGAYYAMQRNEDVETEAEDDYEGLMAKTELSAMRDKADKLISMINDSDDLEAWVQSKISYAKVQLDGVYDYMTYSGEHKPQKPMDQTSPMAANYVNFMNRMGEEFVVEKKGDDEDEADRAANKNIINQMRKAPVDGMHKITFENGKKHMIEPKHVAKALEVHANTPVAKGAKEEVQNALGRSHEDFMHVVKHGKAPAVKPKPKVSLGTMRKEDTDMPTRESGRKAREAIMSVDPKTGRPRVKYFTPARKEIKVTSEELKGNQHKIDANKNGKIDKHDFKLLRSKKKVQEAEEMTAANVAKAAATQTQFGAVGNRNMQQDSVDKIKTDPLASKEKVVLPPTQGNKPIGGETQTHPNIAEEILLNKLYDSLSEQNKVKFEQMLETDEGIEYLLDFAREQGL